MKNQKLGKVALVLALSLAASMPSYAVNAATATDQTTITTTVAETVSLDCSANIPLGTITAGTPVENSATCGVTSNANGGFDLAVKRDDASSTIDHMIDGTTNIADKTEWTPGAPNSAVWSGTGLGFRVLQTGTDAAAYNSTFWGSDDTVTNATFAGFPTTYENIASTSAYAASQVNVVVGAKLDVPGTQKSGAYDGTVTFQVTTKP